MGNHQRSFERYHTRPHTASRPPRLGVRNFNPKLQSLLSQERVKLRTAKLADTFTGSIRKIWDKRERGRVQGLPNFFEYPLLSQEWVKLRTSNLTDTFTGSTRTKAYYNFGSKGSVGVCRDCPIFLSMIYYLYYLRNG